MRFSGKFRPQAGILSFRGGGLIAFVLPAVLVVPGCRKPDSLVSAEEAGYEEIERPSKEKVATPDDVIVIERDRSSRRPAGSQIQVTLPVARIVKDSQGRELDVDIVGKDRTHLTVVRRADGKRFKIAIASLSTVDQEFAGTLLNQVAPAEVLEEPEVDLKLSGAVESIDRQISRIDDKIQILNRQINDPSLGEKSPRRRGMESEVKRLQAEKLKLELKLDELDNAASLR